MIRLTKTCSADLLLAMILGWLIAVPAAAQDLPLTKIADLNATSRAEAAARPEVRVRGVVSLVGNGLSVPLKSTSELGDFCLEDETAGIWIPLAWARRDKIWTADESLLIGLHEGSEIEIEGVLHEGGFSPVILPKTLRRLGEKTLPPPSLVSLERFLSGAADVQRVQVSGVVQSVVDDDTSWLLKVETGLGHFITHLPKTPAFSPSRLLDAEVRMIGLAAASRNWRSEFICPRLVISREEHVTVEKPAPDDPFAAPKFPLKALNSYSAVGNPRHRRRTEGTVIYNEPDNVLFIQEGDYAVRVEPGGDRSLMLGDRVEVTGFIDLSRKVAGLGGAMIRKIGSGPPQVPVPITWAEIETDYEQMRWGKPMRFPGLDGLLVSVTGRLIGKLDESSDGVTRLELDCGDSTTTAFVHGATGDLRPGTELRATGVASVQYSPSGQLLDFPLPSRLDLLLRAPSDLTVLQAASWWTRERMYAAMGILIAVLAAGGLWIRQLRRVVARQTKRWERTLRAHRDSELEMKGAREERYRLAGDLHDGLQQHLTGASFRLEAALLRLGDQAPEVNEQFIATRAALERTRTGLRECLLGLRSVEEGPAEFAALLRHAAGKMEHWPKGAVEIVADGEPFPLSRHVMGTLLLFMQEAVANAFKHGAASHVRVALRYLPESLEMHINDDGSGFEPALAPDATAGHFGVESMRHRLRWLGGSAEFLSQPGEGTRVIARLARKTAEERADPTEFESQPS